jgi:hypothetical protein
MCLKSMDLHFTFSRRVFDNNFTSLQRCIALRNFVVLKMYLHETNRNSNYRYQRLNFIIQIFAPKTTRNFLRHTRHCVKCCELSKVITYVERMQRRNTCRSRVCAWGSVLLSGQEMLTF